MGRWMTLIVVVISAIGISYAFWQWMFGYRFTEADVKRLIESRIPIGSTNIQVMNFLVSQGWQRSDYEKTPEHWKTDRNNPVYGSHAYIGAGPPDNIGPGFIHLGHIGVFFLFDQNDRLTKYSTRQYYEGFL